MILRMANISVNMLDYSTMCICILKKKKTTSCCVTRDALLLAIDLKKALDSVACIAIYPEAD